MAGKIISIPFPTLDHGIDKDEITFLVTIQNTGTDSRYYYVDLRDENDKFLEKAPPVGVKMSADETKILTISSLLALFPSWNIDDVDCQTVKFELREAKPAIFKKYATVDTMHYGLESLCYIPPSLPDLPDILPDCTGTSIILDVEIVPIPRLPFAVGAAEVKFIARIENGTTCTKWYRCSLHREDGTHIDTEPDFFGKKIEAGQIGYVTISSLYKLWHAGTIPTTEIPYIQLLEMEFLGSYKAIADKRNIPMWKAYTYVEPEPPIDLGEVWEDVGEVWEDVKEEYEAFTGTRPTIKIPSFAITDKPITISGVSIPNAEVDIRQDKGLFASDPKLTSFMTDESGKYSGEYIFPDAGVYKIYARTGIIGKESDKKTIFVLSMVYIIMIVAAISAIVYFKMKQRGE